MGPSRIELAIVIISVISCLFSSLVVITIAFFKPLRRGHFFPIIMYMAISDTFMNVFSAFGFPENGSGLCWAQCIGVNYFGTASFFWTTLLSYKVYCVVTSGKFTMTWLQMHILGWGVPVILSTIFLTTNDVGAPPENAQWCIIRRRGNNPRWLTTFWSYSCFYFWLFSCAAAMIYWQCSVYWKFRRSGVRDKVKRTYDKLYWYPIVMIVCWTLNYACTDLVARRVDKRVVAVSMIAGIMNGLLTAIIFMIKSEEAKERWAAYFFPQSHPRTADERPTLNYGKESNVGRVTNSSLFAQFGFSFYNNNNNINNDNNAIVASKQYGNQGAHVVYDFYEGDEAEEVEDDTVSGQNTGNTAGTSSKSTMNSNYNHNSGIGTGTGSGEIVGNPMF